MMGNLNSTLSQSAELNKVHPHPQANTARPLIPTVNDLNASSIRLASRVASSIYKEEKKLDRAHFSSSKKAKINVEYRFHWRVQESSTTNTRASLKRKVRAMSPEAKFKKLVSDVGKVWFDWDVSNESFAGFKMAAIDAIRHLDTAQIATYAQTQEDEENLGWLAVIPHGGVFEDKNKTLLDTRKVFLEFLNQLKVPCEGRKLKYTITLIGPDPKLAARKRQALRSLQAQHGQPEDIKEIDQKPRERLSGSSELLVSVDPDDSRRYVPLTSDRIALRACAIVGNEDATETNPPTSPSFEFKTSDEYRGFVKGRASPQMSPSRRHLPRGSSDNVTPSQEPSGSIPTSSSTVSKDNSPAVTMNMPGPSCSPMASVNPMIPSCYMIHPMAWLPPWAYGQSPMMYPASPPLACPSGPSNIFPIPTATTPAMPRAAPVSSPVTSDKAEKLNDYLCFVDVDPSDSVVSQVMSDLGIASYTGFLNFKASELEKAGIKKSPARLLVSSVRKFERHLKANHPPAQ
ncbi:hypothetical protein PCANC_22371 [Puccinia coronata f. sp. avenae]|nr:hypothetical protein PCANC_22371 [Puccinia coronata f. sp. avenae]